LTKSNGITQIANGIFRALCSLKLAVIVILLMAIGLGTATVLESIYDTPTAQYWIYRSTWFYLVFIVFGLNILCVALSRWPWKRRHIPFLLAHAGILILLFGSWLTDLHGLDGSLRLVEGQSNAQVEINQPVLMLSENNQVKRVPIRWTPPNARFRPVEVSEYGLRVSEFLTHADAKIAFTPAKEVALEEKPAVRLKMQGGPMKISQEFWLWGGDPAWSLAQAGPAKLALLTSAVAGIAAFADRSGPTLALTPAANGDVLYNSFTSDGATKSGRLKADKIQGQTIETGWRGGVTIQVLEWIPNADSQISYTPSKMQYGTMAPPPAIHLVAGEGQGKAEMWLGLGDRANLEIAGRKIQIGFFNERQILPFALKLNRFNIERYEGTRDPASYASNVSIVDEGGEQAPVTISMNEPLAHRGITFYQASYEEADPRPTVSILSVNRDPGRWLKYTGSIMIVLGSILLFAVKYWKKRRPAGPPAAEATV
jgi:hypothetical protein